MKKQILALVICSFICFSIQAQQEDHNTPAIGAADAKEDKAVIKKIEKAEKKAKKEEKALKKEEKEEKKREKLNNAISSKKKSIAKDEKKIISLEEKLVKGTQKGRLSPVAIQKMNAKIEKLKSGIIGDKGKLEKLIKKQ